MRHTLHFLTDDDGRVLLREDTLAYGLAYGYERGAAELGVSAGTRVRVELLDDSDHVLDRRTYLVPVASNENPTRIASVA